VEHDELDAALATLRLVAGTTNRRRKRLHATPERPDAAARQLVSAARGGPVGVLFGSEDAGLSVAAMSRCPLVITIPSATERPALNLSHAVQVVAYELFLAAAGEMSPPPPDLASAVELEALYRRIMELMVAAGFRPREDDPESFLPSMRRCFGRAALEGRDVRTVHRILAAFEKLARHKGRSAGGKAPEREQRECRVETEF
jgi:TrmH family RNA methyltransferase